MVSYLRTYNEHSLKIYLHASFHLFFPSFTEQRLPLIVSIDGYVSRQYSTDECVSGVHSSWFENWPLACSLAQQAVREEYTSMCTRKYTTVPITYSIEMRRTITYTHAFDGH
jgi:hypothetical protein